MKLLWVKTDFLHPTNRGGQIRTLEMLKRLHARHEIHYVALTNGNPAAIARSGEYCSHVHPIKHQVADKRSLHFAAQLFAGLVSPLPVALGRYRSRSMARELERLIGKENFDCIVCDFLASTPNVPDLGACVLFQHNVEATIWNRHASHAPTPAHRAYFQLQAKRMLAYEGRACRSARRVIAVSHADEAIMRKQYGVERISTVPTGVDLDYFAPPRELPSNGALAFVGAMDWLPNVDGALWFVHEVLPLIRRKKPECPLVLVGRNPAREIANLAKMDPRIRVTGTVPDVRPHLWGTSVSIVPLRIGSGTRLKIFESMAARVPVVSTTVGAEGLPVENRTHLHVGDSPEAFAAACLELLESQEERRRISDAAWELVSSRFSWELVSWQFEAALPC